MKTLIIAILGALKLVLDALGYDLITDDFINTVVTVAAGIAIIIGTVRDNVKKYKEKKAA